MKDFFEEGPAGVSFRRAGGRIRAELTIGEEPVSPARFLRRVPGATLLHNSVRPDGSVCVARFPALYRNLASLARGGALELYAPPALRNLVELAVPMGFSLRFPYDRAGKRLAIECSEPGFLYDGQGCFLGKAGFIRIAKLEAADPVAEDIRYIPGRHLNLFMRVLLPAIREAVPADCPLNLSPTPPVELAVECWTAEEARLRVRWEVPLSSLTDCGCTGLCLAGNTLYPGDLAMYLELPCRYDGVFQLEGAARQAVEHRIADPRLPVSNAAGAASGPAGATKNRGAYPHLLRPGAAERGGHPGQQGSAAAAPNLPAGGPAMGGPGRVGGADDPFLQLLAHLRRDEPWPTGLVLFLAGPGAGRGLPRLLRFVPVRVPL